MHQLVMLPLGGPQEMEKCNNRDLPEFSKEECQALLLGRNNGVDH